MKPRIVVRTLPWQGAALVLAVLLLHAWALQQLQRVIWPVAHPNRWLRLDMTRVVEARAAKVAAASNQQAAAHVVGVQAPPVQPTGQRASPPSSMRSAPQATKLAALSTSSDAIAAPSADAAGADAGASPVATLSPLRDSTAPPVEPVAPQHDPTATVGQRAEVTGDVDVPTYPTQLPPSFVRHYRMQRHNGTGTAELSWRREGDAYQASLSAISANGVEFEWRSAGAVDGAGVAPLRFVDRRRGRGAQAANFQREIGKISYSGPAVQAALPGGAQDRLSWVLQLAGVVAARPAHWQAGEPIMLYVSGAHGDAQVWRFVVQGRTTLQLEGTAVPTLLVQREASGPYDTHVQAWLALDGQALPVQLRWANGTIFTELTLASPP